MTEPAATVAALLDLASAAQRPAAEAILDRARDLRLRVLVAGEAKRGKSTLLNRLLDRDLLPTGVLPVTAISTTVRHGDADQLVVHYLDGREEARPLDDLARFVTERENPDNRLRIDAVEAILAYSRLAGQPVELVDTPGTGSVYEHNTEAARESYASLDAVIMVLTATPPMSAAERDLLHDVAEHAVRTFVVMNKIDQLAADELAETINFTERICRDAGVRDARIWPMSARAADPGLVDFRTHFETYLRERAAQDSDRAIRAHARRLAEGMHDEAAVELRAIELGRGTAQTQLTAFRARLGALTEAADSLDDRCHAAARRLRRELDENARRFTADLTVTARAAVQDAIEKLPTDAGPAEIEQSGRDTVETVVSAAVLDWRAAHADELERRLCELLDAVERERASQLDTLRGHASDLLGLEISAGVAPLPLRPGRLFWLDFTMPPAVELPGTQTLRRHGPGAVRRAQQRVLDDVRDLTDRQVGRARADLQHRLGETVRQLAAVLRVHHIDTLHRLGDALERAHRLHDQAAPEVDEQAAALRHRIAQLDGLCAQLPATP